jgi:cytochrome P450
MHFGLGGRQCIGKTIATTNIYKLMSTLLREFEFDLEDEGERREVEEGGFRGRMPSLVSVGVSELEEPLMVRARIRGSK